MKECFVVVMKCVTDLVLCKKKQSVFLLFIVLSVNINGQQYKISSKEEYKKTIVKNYYLFQKNENEHFLDSIITIIKLNKFIVKEDSINSKILYLRAVNNLELRRFKKAENLFIKSFELAEKTNDVFLKGTIYNSRGIIYSLAYKDYVKAAEFYKKAIVNHKEVNNVSQLFDTYYNLTKNYRQQSKWKESTNYANDFLKLIENGEKRTSGVDILHYFIADNYFNLKNNEESLKNLKIAESLTLKDDSELHSLINTLYAKYYENEGNFTLAIKKYKEVNKNLEETIINDEKRIKASFVKELELENELKNKKDLIINNQKTKLIVSGITIVLFITFIVFLILLRRKNKNKNKQIKSLNLDLNELISDLKIKNEDLTTKKSEIESLLNLNEQTLFSRVLKISTYNDTIRKVSVEIDNYIDTNVNSAKFLISINKKLNDLISEEELWEDFKIQFEKIRPDFFSKLKQISPNLSVNDLKHCTYIVSNLKSKEVAQLINVSPRSVETTRYRLKKKIGLEKEDSLYDLLSTL
ncbi:tetratricopeptide repeat protein [Tenacibaculum insulae]|uniref:tetratricopeptide repeat protein n=1 Tax=Tenacibaculum insulae TaxID=2029677 RepID=UPI003AB48E8A